MQYITVIILITAVLATVAAGQGITYSTEAELKQQIEAVPCKSNRERLQAVRELFMKSGASADEVKIEKLKDVENVVVTKRGKTDDKVVIGAHYDRTNDGCGAIDNWTGIVILANIYRTLRPLSTSKTYVFAAFGREEEGLYGSKAMAEQIRKEDRPGYCAMVNFDSFGFANPQVMRNISSRPLISLAESVSKDMKIPFAQASIEWASSDSAPFLEKGIPAISLHGLNDRWPQYLHTAADKISNVNTQSVYLGYRHGVIMLARIEAASCGAFLK
jgi:Zn-dependent M28 family amino/carboxypeptidase